MGNMDKSFAAKTLLSILILPTVQEGVSLSIGWITIPNQSSVAKAHEQFERDGKDAAFALLRQAGRCDGGIAEIHAFDAGCRITSRAATPSARKTRKNAPGGPD